MAKSPKKNKDQDDREGKKHKKEKKERRRAERTTAAEASTPQRPRPQQDEQTLAIYNSPLKQVQIEDRTQEYRTKDTSRREKKEEVVSSASSAAERLLQRTDILEGNVEELRDETKYIMDTMARQRKPTIYMLQ